MDTASIPPAPRTRRRMPAQTHKAQTRPTGIRKATTSRQLSRVAAALKQGSQGIRRSRRLQGEAPSQPVPSPAPRTISRKRRRDEDAAAPYYASPESIPKRVRTRGAPVRDSIRPRTLAEVRIEYWRTYGSWPTEEEEATMKPYQVPLARKKSSRSTKSSRSSAGVRRTFDEMSNTETLTAPTTNDQILRDWKTAPYSKPSYESQLREKGGYMSKHKGGINAESKKLCQTLLRSEQKTPKGTVFDDTVFERALELVKGRNETRVIRDIAELIVPPAELLDLRGDEDLPMLRETLNAPWTNAIPVTSTRPQPAYSLGFKSEAFTQEERNRLRPFIGNPEGDVSYFAATYDMYFPFLTCEVKCGASALDIADRQNAHSQTVQLRGLYQLFRLVNREQELHSEINGFSVSHSDVDVRIYGYYLVIEGEAVNVYRHPITEFNISPTEEGDQRWKAYKIVRNIYQHWLPRHWSRIRSVINAIPPDVSFEVSDPSEPASQHRGTASSRSGLSQTFENHSLTNVMPETQQVTPGTTVHSSSEPSPKRKKR